MFSCQTTPAAFSRGDRFEIEDSSCSVCAAVKNAGGHQVGFLAAARSVVEGQIRFRPNQRLQLALPPFAEWPLSCGELSSMQLVTSRFGFCSVDPRAPHGAAEAQSR
jgi:hypothetical protein